MHIINLLVSKATTPNETAAFVVRAILVVVSVESEGESARTSLMPMRDFLWGNGSICQNHSNIKMLPS